MVNFTMKPTTIWEEYLWNLFQGPTARRAMMASGHSVLVAQKNSSDSKLGDDL